MPGPLTRLRYWWLARRRERQRRDLRLRLMVAWMLIDELRQYVRRDRRAERAERDRLVRELDAQRQRADALQEALRELQGRGTYRPP